MSGVLNFLMFTLFWHSYNFKSISYCTDLCEGKPIHTLCTYPTPGPSTQCSGWTDAPLSDMEKQRLLNKLNQRRDEVAAGRSRRVPPAANMLNLHWVEELAESAQRWADQCIAHTVPDTKDHCRDLLTMTAGQTIATVTGASSGLTATVMADMWYMEGLYYDGNVSSYIPPQHERKDYTSFTQMVWATTFMVGCGRVRFMGRHGNRMQQLERLVCDWAPGGNVEGARVFAVGTPGSLCPTGATRGHHMSHLCVYQNETLQELLNKLKPIVAENEYTEYTSTSLPITSTVIENIVSALKNSTIQRDNDTKSIDFDFLSGIQDSMQAFKDEILGLVNSTEVNEVTNITTIKPTEDSKRKANSDELLDLGFDIVITSTKLRQLVTKPTQATTSRGVNASGNFSDILNDVLNVNASDIFELFAEPVSVPSSSSPKDFLKTNDEDYDDDENLKGWTGAELIPTEGPDVDDVTEFGEEGMKDHISNGSTTNSDEELSSSQDYNLLAIFTDKDSYYEDYPSNSKRDEQDIYYDDDDADALKKSYDPSRDRPRLQRKFKSKRDKNNPSGKFSSGTRQRKKSRKKEQIDPTDNIPKKVEDAVHSLLEVLDGAFDGTTNQSTTAKNLEKHKHSRPKGHTRKPSRKNSEKQLHSESKVDDSQYDDAKKLDYYHDFPKEKGTGIEENAPESSVSSATQTKAFTESIDEVSTEQTVVTTATNAHNENFEDDGILTYEPSHKTEAKVIDKDDMLYYDEGASIATTRRKNILKKMSRTRNPHSRLKGRTKTPQSKVVASPAPTERKMLIPNQNAAGQGVTFFSPPPEPLGEQEEPEFPQFFGPNSTLESIPNAAKSLLRLFNDDIQKDNFPVSDIDLDSNATDYESPIPKRQQSKFFDDPEDMVDGNIFMRRRTDEELDQRANFNEALEKVNSTDVLELFQSLRGSPLERPPDLRRNSKKNRQKENFHNDSAKKASRNSRKRHKNKGNKNNRRRTKHVKRYKSRRSFPDSQLFGRKRDGKDVFYDYSVENLNAKHANGSDFEMYHDSIQYTDEDVVKNSSTLYGSRGKENKTTRFPIQVRMNEDKKLAVNQTSPANMLFDEMSQNVGDKLANLVARRHANATFLSEGEATANLTSLMNVSQALASSASRLCIETTLYFMFLVFVSLIK